MMKHKVLVAGAAMALSLSGFSAAHALTFVATGTGGDGPESAQAVITTGANTISVDLTSLITSANGASKLAAGEEVSGIQIFLSSAPTSASYGSGTGQLIDIAGGGGVTDVSGNPTHWGVALSGSDVYLATAGAGAHGGKPIDLIIGDAESYPTVNSSITGRNPQIQGTGHFIIDLVGGLNEEVTKVKFEFGTGPDNVLDGVCTGGGCGGVSVPEPATWAMMLVGFFGLGAVLRRQRSRIVHTA